jgi:hypothetical protein
MAENPSKSPLDGLSAEVRRTMERLLRTPPEAQKEAPKPVNVRAEAQRRRRERERRTENAVQTSRAGDAQRSEAEDICSSRG